MRFTAQQVLNQIEESGADKVWCLLKPHVEQDPRLPVMLHRAPSPTSLPASLAGIKHPLSPLPLPLSQPTSPPPNISINFSKAPADWHAWIAKSDIQGHLGGCHLTSPPPPFFFFLCAWNPTLNPGACTLRPWLGWPCSYYIADAYWACIPIS